MSEVSNEFGPSEYLCYRLLVALERSRSQAISRSKFHKLSCIADRHLQSELDCDVGLPRYWYIYGEVVDEQSLDGGFYHAPAAKFWSGQRYVPVENVNGLEFSVPETRRELINEAIEWTVGKFERANTGQITKYLYHHHIPNEFVKTYSELRTRLKRVDFDEQYTLGDFEVTSKSTREFVTTSLDRMVETYPRDDYPEAHDLFLQWSDVVELLVTDSDPNYAAIEAFLDSLVAFLAKVELRFHHRQHIPDDRIKAWEDERLEVKESFASKLSDKRQELAAE